jgi:lipooligosaccharide transport system ATP-binding protein
VEREVVELRFVSQDGVASQLEGVGKRLEVLADRIVIGTDNGDAALDAVHARGLEPESVLVRRSTLEDVFLCLTGRSLID